MPRFDCPTIHTKIYALSHTASYAVFLVTLLAAVVTGGCANPAKGHVDGRGTLTVFAASSLTEAFSEAGLQFERDNPGVHVRLSFAGSQALRLQVEYGAPADVIATANARHVAALVQLGRASDPQVIAHNALAIVVPLANPARVHTFEQLDRAHRLVVGAPSVPIGRYTQLLLQRSSEAVGARFATAVRSHIVSRENNVRLARAKVELGEADAAVVYLTDARASKRVRTVAVPDAINVKAQYQQALISDAENVTVARLWQRHMLSAAGQATLQAHGFLPAAGQGSP